MRGDDAWIGVAGRDAADVRLPRGNASDRRAQDSGTRTNRRYSAICHRRRSLTCGLFPTCPCRIFHRLSRSSDSPGTAPRHHPRWGWRKAHALCRAEGLAVNHKRTQRLWREEGLRRPDRVRKKRRIGEGRNQRLRATYPDQMWALGFQVDATVDGRHVRFLNIVDEFTREALATQAFRSCTSDQLIGVLERIIAETGRVPAHIRMGNGTEMTAYAMQDWCRFTGVDASFKDPGAPWQNGVCESFNGRFRDEFLACEVFHSLTEVQVLADDWRIEYNSNRPHGSLEFRSPEAFRAHWLETEGRQQLQLA